MCDSQALLMDSLILNSVAHILLLLPTTDPKNEEKTGLNYLMMVISDTQYIFDRIPPRKRNAPNALNKKEKIKDY